MRVESSVLSVSWIPSEAITGLTALPFDVGVTHYDDPPPDVITDLESLRVADRFRFANELRAWIEVEDGRITDHGHTGRGHLGSSTIKLARSEVTFAAVAFPDLRPDPVVTDTSVRFIQTAGGRTGLPAPRRVAHPPFVQLAAPSAWTTLTLTIHVDGSSTFELTGASPFPRHWLYDATGQLTAKTGLIEFETWYREAFGRHTPWGDEDSPAMVTEVESALERQLSLQIMRGGERPVIRTLTPESTLVEQGAPGEDLFLLLDGVLAVEVDGRPLAEVGPGALVGERAILEGGRRTSTLRALTRCRVAVAHADAVDRDALLELSRGHRREERGPG